MKNLNGLKRTFLSADRHREERDHVAVSRRARLTVSGLSVVVPVIIVVALVAVAVMALLQVSRGVQSA